MASPVRAGSAPIGVEVQAGNSYWWCACGRSASQPFCDGSHKGSEFTPVRYEATETRRLFFCVCKGTGTRPLCDGSHKEP